ncbi:hypothetical protein SKAU_G00327970 [Synaphobranchus kaupii]|uniref:Transmembrane protein 211 n=1 Tax=Synaphobranchus kaupii TaxID=118154 RepID=A0A9Q1IKK4_SYNKA|nr:hypothetical protein SKAU_G00327970 [Synaphobranchus kaupii]
MRASLLTGVLGSAQKGQRGAGVPRSLRNQHVVASPVQRGSAAVLIGSPAARQMFVLAPGWETAAGVTGGGMLYSRGGRKWPFLWCWVLPEFPWWKRFTGTIDATSAVLCSGGCALLAVSSLLAIITIFLPSGACERRICTLAGYMQMAAVFIMASGLLVYPFGLNSTLVRSFCGDSGVYYAGECQIGWGYMLAIVGVMLTLFLPFFAKYAPKEHLSPTPLPTIL